MAVAGMCRRVGAVACLVTSSSWAQPGPTSTPPAAPPPPAAASATDAPSALDTAALTAASAAFNRGAQLYEAKKYKEALVEFEHAYQLSPVFTTLYYVGASNVKLERWAPARRAFELYLELGKGQLPPETVDNVRVDLEELKKNTSTLNLTLNVPGADVHIDGAPVEPTAIGGLVVDPGQHVVRVTKPGFLPIEEVVEAPKGEEMHVLLPLVRALPNDAGTPPPASSTGPLAAATDAPHARVPLWVPWTITGALATGWVTTAALAIKARHDRDIIEQPGTSDERIDAARRLHITLAVVSDVLLASTLASAGISAYLTWWSDAPPSSAAAKAKSGSASDPVWAIGVSGQF
jgi:tetratricopeptide (TPR) repeat protein